MSRIRSIHPGIWTDEAFMSVSAHARLFLMGLWTEAFDDGVFEWKPLTLKARIFPVDNVDVGALLMDLVEAGCISRMESHPKKPGVIRNFQRYQRPKKPNSSGMLAPEWQEYVGAKAAPADSDDESSEPVPHQYGTSSEKSPQMEDEGGRMVSSILSDSSKRETRERDDFQDWFNDWPSAASDDDDVAYAAWQELSPEDRSEAMAKSSAYIEAAKGGGRTAICSAAKYLRKHMWKRVRDKPPTPPPKAASGAKPQTREEYIAAELARSERSFRR